MPFGQSMKTFPAFNGTTLYVKTIFLFIFVINYVADIWHWLKQVYFVCGSQRAFISFPWHITEYDLWLPGPFFIHGLSPGL